ncbi:type I polyketide synthase, partial [Streptomyces nanshensis]
MTTHATSLTELHEQIRTGRIGQDEALRLIRAWQQGRQTGSEGEPAQRQATGDDAAARGEALRERVCDIVTHAVSELLKVGPDDLDADVELSEYGLDSIVMSQLVNAVNDELGLELAPTVLFEHPNLRAFSAHLADTYADSLSVRLLGTPGTGPAPAPSTASSTATSAEPAAVAAPSTSPPEARTESPAPPPPATGGRFFPAAAPSAPSAETEPAPAPAPAPAPEQASPAQAFAAEEPVAVVGMSGRFPMADDLAEFWENLREGRDCIREVPSDRWDWREYYGDPVEEPGRTDVKWGGFIDGVADFDPLFFGIAPKEALHMDPQQRLLMLYVWKALEDAGHSADSLAGSDLAMFVGTNDTGYGTLAERCGKRDSVSPTGGVPSLGPNRMSFFLDVHGPSEPVETACSSSLVAMHRGVTAIARAECETAVVGGINTIVVPDGHVSFSRAGMLSVDGR